MDELGRLAVEAREGNPEALAELLRRTQPEVWRFCAAVLGSQDADDATQETYLAAWRGLGSFRGESSVRTWLLAIAKRTSAWISRQRHRWPDLSVTTNELEHRDPSNLLEVEQLLAWLDPERRVAFVLTQLLGFTYAEAAEICDCPVGTIRSRVARARSDLVERWWQAERGDRFSGSPRRARNDWSKQGLRFGETQD